MIHPESDLGSTPKRTLRYNAKTSISTRYPNDFAISGHLLRNTEGALGIEPVPSQELQRIGSTATKKRPHQDDSDYFDEAVVEIESTRETIQTRSSMPRYTSLSPDMQLLHELLSTIEKGTLSKIGPKKSDSQSTLYIFACNLQCKTESTSASASCSIRASQPRIDNNKDAAGAPNSSTRAVHWHSHTHSAGRHPHGHEHLGLLLDSRSVCLDVQHLQGALARRKTKKPWPADQAVLETFLRVNGKYDLEILGDGGLAM